MSNEIKQCQNCHNDFTIEPEDFDFYEKMKVPPPTWCPECRLQRRLSFCNERHLYKNTCGLCGKSMISMYPQGTPFPVYCLDCYRSDKWDPLSFGKTYEFNKSFFEQFAELKLKVPRAQIVQQGESLGSEYCNRASYNKNCYQIVRANYNEDCFYSYLISESKDCMDCFNVDKSELAYEGIDLFECYNVQYSQESRQCRNSYFLFDCRNCSDCIGCVGLRNKQCYIFNQPFTKDEYKKKMEELQLATRNGIENISKEFTPILHNFIRESIIKTNCVNVSGNWLINCKDVKDSYQSRDVENGKHLVMVFKSKDCMDYCYWGRNAELMYETANCGYNCSRIRFINECWDSCHDLTYCDNCYSSSNIFGCVGLKNQEYCIFNIRYSKQEYEELVPKIIKHMNDMPYVDKKGRAYKYGEFFPTQLSASGYNTTVAQEHFPLTEKEVQEQGYTWEALQEKEYKPTKSWEDLPDDIKTVSDEIIKEIILCKAYEEIGNKATQEHNCTKAFRITPSELAFYRKMNIPLPKECLNTRHFNRFKQRNPLKLWHRHCMCKQQHSHHSGQCPNEFETSYAPERPEIIYCEACYQAEVV